MEFRKLRTKVSKFTSTSMSAVNMYTTATMSAGGEQPAKPRIELVENPVWVNTTKPPDT